MIFAEQKQHLQEKAEEIARESGLACVVALGWNPDEDGGKGALLVGAWVPDVEVLELLLERALTSIKRGQARIVDVRRGRS